MSKTQSDTSYRLTKFDEKINFRRWKNQAEFWLFTLGLHTALAQSPDSNSFNPGLDGQRRLSISTIDQTSSSSTPSRTSEEIDFHCCHRILSVLSNQMASILILRLLWTFGMP